MSIKKHTSYTWESPDGETFPIPFEFSGGSELFKMSDDGLSAVLGVLDQDQDAQDPIKEGDEGELVIFGWGRNTRPGIEDWKRLIRSNTGFIVPVNYGDYGSSGSRISCGRILTAKDCRGDKRTGENSAAENVLDDMGGYYIVPSDVTDPKGYADGTMETLEQYYNGEVYGVCVWSYTRDFAEYDLDGQGIPGEYTEWGEPEREECWGFYGSEYAEKELQEQFDATDFIKPAPAGNSKQGELICQ